MSQKVSNSSNQIPLDFKDTKVKTFTDFIIGKNQSVIDSLYSFTQSSESLFYIWGQSGIGKSHVLQAFINSINLKDKSAVILKSKELTDRQNVSLIEMFDYICIDKVENFASDELLEEALFFWINEVRQAQKKIILAGQFSNKNVSWQLPDLRSRLQSGRTHELKAIERNEVIKVFNNLAKQKGIIINARVSTYLENNCPMNLGFLNNLLNKLDKTTLVEKKHVTIPLIKKILNTKLVN